MTPTNWTELATDECTVVAMQRGAFSGKLLAVQIRHAQLKCARWFTSSARDNWYSRNTNGDGPARGYIVRGELDLTQAKEVEAAQ